MFFLSKVWCDASERDSAQQVVMSIEIFSTQVATNIPPK